MGVVLATTKKRTSKGFSRGNEGVIHWSNGSFPCFHEEVLEPHSTLFPLEKNQLWGVETQGGESSNQGSGSPMLKRAHMNGASVMNLESIIFVWVLCPQSNKNKWIRTNARPFLFILLEKRE